MNKTKTGRYRRSLRAAGVGLRIQIVELMPQILRRRPMHCYQTTTMTQGHKENDNERLYILALPKSAF